MKWLSSGGRGIVLRTSSGWLGLAAGLWVTVLAVRGRAYPASDVLGLGQLAGGSLLALAGAVALSRLFLHGEKKDVLQARGTVLAFGSCGSNVGPRGMGGGGHPGRDRHRGEILTDLPWMPAQGPENAVLQLADHAVPVDAVSTERTGVLPLQHPAKDGDERGEIVPDRAPQHIPIEPEVLMNDEVAHVAHLSPRDVGPTLGDIGGHARGCFSENRDVLDHCIDQHPVTEECVSLEIFGQVDRRLNGIEHVGNPQVPVPTPHGWPRP